MTLSLPTHVAPPPSEASQNCVEINSLKSAEFVAFYVLIIPPPPHSNWRPFGVLSQGAAMNRSGRRREERQGRQGAVSATFVEDDHCDAGHALSGGDGLSCLPGTRGR